MIIKANPIALSAAATHKIYKANTTPTKSSIDEAKLNINKFMLSNVSSIANNMLITNRRLKNIPVNPIPNTIKLVVTSKFNVSDPHITESRCNISTVEFGESIFIDRRFKNHTKCLPNFIKFLLPCFIRAFKSKGTVVFIRLNPSCNLMPLPTFKFTQTPQFS